MIKHWTDISGHVEGIAVERPALDQADLVSGERALAEAETDAFGAASEKTLRHRAMALTQVKQQASAAASASEEAVLPTSRVGTTSCAREAQRAGNADFATKKSRLPEELQLGVYPSF